MKKIVCMLVLLSIPMLNFGFDWPTQWESFKTTWDETPFSTKVLAGGALLGTIGSYYIYSKVAQKFAQLEQSNATLTQEVLTLKTQRVHVKARDLLKQFRLKVQRTELETITSRLEEVEISHERLEDLKEQFEHLKDNVSAQYLVCTKQLEKLGNDHGNVVELLTNLTRQLHGFGKRMEKSEKKVTLLNVLITNILQGKLGEGSLSYSETSGFDSNEEDEAASSDDEDSEVEKVVNDGREALKQSADIVKLADEVLARVEGDAVDFSVLE